MGQQEGGPTQSERRPEDLPRVDQRRIEGPPAHLFVADDPLSDVEDEHPEGLHLEASQLGREEPKRLRRRPGLGAPGRAGSLHIPTKFEHRSEPLGLGSGQPAFHGEDSRTQA